MYSNSKIGFLRIFGFLLNTHKTNNIYDCYDDIWISKHIRYGNSLLYNCITLPIMINCSVFNNELRETNNPENAHENIVISTSIYVTIRGLQILFILLRW